MTAIAALMHSIARRLAKRQIDQLKEWWTMKTMRMKMVKRRELRFVSDLIEA